MMEFLPTILYILGSILLIVLIILGIKMISTMDKLDKILDDASGKLKSLNGLFSIVDFTTDKLSYITDRFVDGVTSVIKKIFFRKKEEEESEDE